MINRTPIKTRSAAAARVTQSTELDGATNTPIRCKACAEPNTIRAIRCFECEDEYHVECVEVTERGVQDWRCSACLGKQGDKLKKTTSVPISEPFVSSTNPSSQTMQTTVTSLDTYSNPVQNMSAPSTLLISPGSLFPPLPPHSLLPPHSVIPPNSVQTLLFNPVISTSTISVRHANPTKSSVKYARFVREWKKLRAVQHGAI